jgi:hypothetical protein
LIDPGGRSIFYRGHPSLYCGKPASGNCAEPKARITISNIFFVRRDLEDETIV